MASFSMLKSAETGQVFSTAVSLMVFFLYPPTRKQLAVTAVVFSAGLSLIAFGIYHSSDNIAAQQSRVEARKEFVKARIRKILDD
ncbi:hypothetical protein SAY86_022912 [Trapa natans]|uniref:Uncharacterized protein n=1 Tax=Trapa natans TaxID=22666 RepID=A0AAN7LU58_TRANT|nr:hypothetical protein SAY86_022912 [Trapa natans]